MLRRDRKAQDKQAEGAAAHAGYVSEFEQFMENFLREHPEAIRNQEAGWNIFWDHEVDLKELDRQGRDTVPVKGYDYF